MIYPNAVIIIQINIEQSDPENKIDSINTVTISDNRQWYSIGIIQ